METFSALLAICAGSSPVFGEVPAQRSVTRSVDIFFDPRLNKRLSKQSWGWCFETLSCPLRRQCQCNEDALHAYARACVFIYDKSVPTKDHNKDLYTILTQITIVLRRIIFIVSMRRCSNSPLYKCIYRYKSISYSSRQIAVRLMMLRNPMSPA